MLWMQQPLVRLQHCCFQATMVSRGKHLLVWPQVLTLCRRTPPCMNVRQHWRLIFGVEGMHAKRDITLTVKSCTRAFWMGVEKGSERVRTPPLVFTTDCSFRLYPKMNFICSSTLTR